MWVYAVVALVMMVAAYAFMPRPKVPSSTNGTEDQETPTAEAGKTIPVIFGRVTVKDPNFLYYGENNVTDG